MDTGVLVLVTMVLSLAIGMAIWGSRRDAKAAPELRQSGQPFDPAVAVRTNASQGPTDTPHTDPIPRAIAANDPSTPEALLEKLASDSDEGVRAATAYNRSTPVTALERLASDSNRHARRHVSGNPSAPVRLLEKLVSDPDDGVRERVAGNPLTPLALLERLASDPDVDVRAGVAANPSTPLALLERLASDPHERVRAQAAANPSTPETLLESLASDPDYSVRWGAAANPSTPETLLERLASDPDDSVRSGAADNPSTPETLLETLASDRDDLVRLAVAQNSSTPGSGLEKLASDPNEYVRGAVAGNPSTPARLLEGLATDLNWGVSAAAAANLSDGRRLPPTRGPETPGEDNEWETAGEDSQTPQRAGTESAATPTQFGPVQPATQVSPDESAIDEAARDAPDTESRTVGPPASRIMRELTFRASKLRGDLRLWKFRLSEVGDPAAGVWYAYFYRGELDLGLEDDPSTESAAIERFYVFKAMRLMEDVFPSLTFESGASVTVDDPADEQHPIVVTAKVTLRPQDLDDFVLKEALHTTLAKSPRTPSDVDMYGNIYPDFPAGWNSATDLMEGFILAGALELQVRRRLNPSNPWDSALMHQLPPKYRFDPFGSLLSWGPRVGERGVEGEEIGRLPLLAIAWRYTAEVVDEFRHLRAQGVEPGYYQALASLEGVVLGKHGLILVEEALRRSWFEQRQPAPLTPVEIDFLSGRPIGRYGTLAPDGSLYQSSIWNVAFRLIERRSPDYYINKLHDRLDTVNVILDRGAELGLAGAQQVWPGWKD